MVGKQLFERINNSRLILIHLIYCFARPPPFHSGNIITAGASMDFIPIRGRKKMPSDDGDERNEMHLVHPTAATESAVVRQNKRDSRPLIENTLWSDFMPVRGKKGRMDKILSKEDFLPNRGKKFLLRRINSWLRNRRNSGLSSPKKTKSLPRPASDLMWLTKDDFFPHRGKKNSNDGDKVPFTNLIENDFEDIDEYSDYYAAVPAEVVVDGGANVDDDDEEHGVILAADRDWRPMKRQTRELLNNLSKQEPRDKWRGRKRSDTDHYDNVKLRPAMMSATVALNEVIFFDIYCH